MTVDNNSKPDIVVKRKHFVSKKMEKKAFNLNQKKIKGSGSNKGKRFSMIY